MANHTNAQVLFATDNLAIFPPGGAFNPAAKFAAIGESGGVPGPTPTGCDLYGFRAQINPTLSVNLGMQEVTAGQLAGATVPNLSFEAQRPLLISQTNAGGPGNGDFNGCGKTLAWYFDGLPGPGNIVYSVFGDAFASGGNWIPSDRNLKKDIKPVTDAIKMVQQLNGVSYTYRSDEYPELNLSTQGQYGFIAQEVQEVMPEAVQNGVTPEGISDEYIAMNYNMIIPVLAEAIKEQQTIIETLEDRLAELESIVLDRAETGNSYKSTQSGISLKQNRPNPAEGLTTIEYELPQDMTNASLVIYDARGVAVRRFAVAAGLGTVDYDANEMASGVYFYAIEANGQNLARQKMVIK